MTPQELKNSILQLAIQGRLVEQRPEEGTAEELYHQIQREKAALVKAGKIKKEKPLPEITEEEVPFEIPEGWKWVRLGDYCQKVTDQVASGSFASLRENVPSLKTPDYAIMVKTADFSNGFTKNLTYTTKHGYEFLENSNLFGGELILSNIGSIGKCFIVPYIEHKMTLAPNSVMLRLVQEEGRDYLYYYLISAQGFKELTDITSGTAMRKFNKTELKRILIALPPLAEQKRIVAKIEELLPYIDRYEKAWSRLEDFNKRFPADMQKSILQLAIQGKLVPQRPEEGTGEALYQQIQAEKQSLIRSGKLKKEKPLPEISNDEIPFDIPESWKWVRLKESALTIVDCPHSTPKYYDDETGFYAIGTKCMDGKGRITQLFNVDEPSYYKRNERLTPQENDIVYSREGSIVCRAVILPPGKRICLGQRVMLIRPPKGIYPQYLQMYLMTDSTISILTQNYKGVGVKHINVADVCNVVVPLPPLAEQKRIVTKLEALLPLCERLK